MLGAPLLGLSGAFSSLGVAGAAWVGAAAVLFAIAIVGRRVRDIMVILILGMMFSSGVGAVVQILQYLSSEDSLKRFVVWTMGSLGDVTSAQLWLLAPAVVLGLVLGVAAVKPLNLLLFGEEYAVTMGLSARRTRALLFCSTTLLAGTATAFCGPIHRAGNPSRGQTAVRNLRPSCPSSGNSSHRRRGSYRLRRHIETFYIACQRYNGSARNPGGRVDCMAQ